MEVTTILSFHNATLLASVYAAAENFNFVMVLRKLRKTSNNWSSGGVQHRTIIIYCTN